MSQMSYGEFLPLPSLDTAAVMGVFRRLLLLRLHQAERLSESFMRNLLSWVHPGFSVFAGPPVEPAALPSLKSQARYITRPALAMDALQKLEDGRLGMETPPDPRTGATWLALDPLEWIHRIAALGCIMFESGVEAPQSKASAPLELKCNSEFQI